MAAVRAAMGLEGWSAHWVCSVADGKLGYSGVATLVRPSLGAPLSVTHGVGNPDHDEEGRVVTVELPDCFVVNVYVPNSGTRWRCGVARDTRLRAVAPNPTPIRARTPRTLAGEKLKRLEYRTQRFDRDFAAHVAALQARKPVVVAGDMNCAREPIDIHNARRNQTSAGFTEQERANFQMVRGAGGHACAPVTA